MAAGSVRLHGRSWLGFYPVRAAYSYLLRLHRFGLLERKGRQRVAWLGIALVRFDDPAHSRDEEGRQQPSQSNQDPAEPAQC